MSPAGRRRDSNGHAPRVLLSSAISCLYRVRPGSWSVMYVFAGIAGTLFLQRPNCRNKRMFRSANLLRNLFEIDIGHGCLSRNLLGGFTGDDVELSLRDGEGSLVVEPFLVRANIRNATTARRSCASSTRTSTAAPRLRPPAGRFHGLAERVHYTRLLQKIGEFVATQPQAFSVASARHSSPSSLALLFIDRITLPAGRMMRPAR